MVELPAGFYERMLADAGAFGAPEIAAASSPHDSAGLPSQGGASDPNSAAADDAPEAAVVSMAEARSRRSRRRSVVLAAVVSVAAAAVLVVGLAPASKQLDPPVEAFLARHEKMAAMPAEESLATVDGGFDPMPADHLDTMPAPYAAPPEMAGYERMGAFEHESGAVHVMYSDGTHAMSVYEQPGRIDWNGLPEGGERMTVDGQQAWAMAADGEAMMVVERGPVVYTVVGQGTPEAMSKMAGVLPAEDLSFIEKIRRALGLD
jgi:hypothetical protein